MVGRRSFACYSLFLENRRNLPYFCHWFFFLFFIALSSFKFSLFSSPARAIQGLKDDLDEGKRVTFDKTTDPHAVACLIKLWLRELPEKLIPNDCWKALSLSGDKEENEKKQVFILFCFVLFCFVLFCFVLFCFVLFYSFYSVLLFLTPSPRLCVLQLNLALNTSNSYSSTYFVS